MKHFRIQKSMKTLILIFAIFFFGCGPHLDEVVIESYDDGTPKDVQYYKGEGKNKTMVKEAWFYPDGQLRIEGEFLHGVKNGLWISYYKDGTKWSEGYYKDGINDGLTITWFENGKKYYKGYYKNGDRAGVWKFWDEDGNFIKEIDYGPYEPDE